MQHELPREALCSLTCSGCQFSAVFCHHRHQSADGGLAGDGLDDRIVGSRAGSDRMRSSSPTQGGIIPVKRLSVYTCYLKFPRMEMPQLL